MGAVVKTLPIYDVEQGLGLERTEGQDHVLSQADALTKKQNSSLENKPALNIILGLKQ